MESRNALVTLNIGGCLQNNSRDSFCDAARRWGCDYLEIRHADEGLPPHAMKLKAFELCDADRVFYVDADTVISAGCPSPFELFPADAFVGCKNNQPQMTGECERACVDTIARDLMAINKVLDQDLPNYPINFVNSGVWLVSREHHAPLLRRAYEIVALSVGQTAWKDQSALNYALIELKTPVLVIDNTWNYQFPPDTADGPMRELIYHWAGGDNRDQIDKVNWHSFRASTVEVKSFKPRLLMVADHCVPTGFARVAESLCAHLKDDWEIDVIGINYNGAPHKFPYRIWPARLGGDLWGLGALNTLLPQLQPTAILVIQDPWIVARFATEIARGEIPMAGYMPVDAKNQPPDACHALRALNLAIFYTRFGLTEAMLAGYRGRHSIIPHGVDTEIFRPVDKRDCRRWLLSFDESGEFKMPEDAFVVGNVNRNSPRKRLDLTIQYFAEWLMRTRGDPRQRIDNAYLYLHCAQSDTAGLNLAQLAHYYGVGNRLIIPADDVVTPSRGLPDAEMPFVYGCFDVQVSTTAGEGWGLSQLEGMACGVPQIVPQYAALGEWAAGAAFMVPIEETIAHPVISTVGAMPEKNTFIQALDLFYRDYKLRSAYAQFAHNKATAPEYQWKNIADRFNTELKKMVERVHARINQKCETEQEICNGEEKKVCQ